MDLDSLDSILWGKGSSNAFGASAPEDRGISFEEFQWQDMDKQLDSIRKQRGMRPYGEKRRAADLENYLKSIERKKLEV